MFKLIDALARLHQGDPKALEALPLPDEHDTGLLLVLGIAQLNHGSAERAAAMFKQILDRHPFASVRLPLSELCYGRALAKLGKPLESRRAYDQFFADWNQADATLPVLIAARTEYKALPSNEASAQTPK
jgi:hypothetical protein